MHTTRELLFAADIPVPADPPAVRFSPRGREVMELFMRGRTYREIAQCLGISLSGVRRHREKMLWQNNCESMLELIARYRAGCAGARNPDQESKGALCKLKGE
ncbi:MAG: helix-turn-helix transcriptional regulator [Desulfovibrio sp.]|nr:helix-turn-helix transcriptional regulator [Desulfovibrio sp.]